MTYIYGFTVWPERLAIPKIDPTAHDEFAITSDGCAEPAGRRLFLANTGAGQGFRVLTARPATSPPSAWDR